MMSLSPTHSYYTQIQGQIAVVNARWGHFFVFSKHGYFFEKIDRNDLFIEELLGNLSMFFSKYVLPELMRQRGSVG